MTTTSSARTHTINPLGTDGFEFVEYTAPDAKGIAALKALFVSLGFAEVAKHKHKQCWLYRQGTSTSWSMPSLTPRPSSLPACTGRVSAAWRFG